MRTPTRLSSRPTLIGKKYAIACGHFLPALAASRVLERGAAPDTIYCCVADSEGNCVFAVRRRPLQHRRAVPGSTTDALSALGHPVEKRGDVAAAAGAVCAVMRDPGTKWLHAGADPRREAYAIAW